MAKNFRFIAREIARVRFRSFFLLFGAAFFIFLLDFGPFFTNLKGSFQDLLNPLRRDIYLADRSFLHTSLGFGRNRERLSGDQKLRMALSRCQGQLVSLQQVLDENRRLRHLLAMPLPPDLKFDDAQIIGSQGDYLIINKGAKEGVKDGQLVLTGNYLVGRIEKVMARQAEALRVDSARFSIPVLIFKGGPTCLNQHQSCQQGKGITRGTRVEKILREESAAEGDLVALLGDPRGVLVGRVIAVSKSANKVFLEAKFEPLADFSRLTEVFLVR